MEPRTPSSGVVSIFCKSLIFQYFILNGIYDFVHTMFLKEHFAEV